MKATSKSPQSTDLIDLLRHAPLFAGIGDPILKSLEASSYRKRVEKGTRIFYRDEPANDFYLLLEGDVDLTLASPDGRELVINMMRPGDFFGELGLLIGQPRSADAVARTAVDLIVIPCKAFITALECEPRLMRRMLDVTATRLSRTSEFQNALAFLDAHARLARVLLDLDIQNEEKGYITISQEELAQRSGLIRQTVAKTLGQWRRKGWLLTGRGHIVLLNQNALRLCLTEHAG